MRKISGGDTYTIIYLKMLLLSLKNEGKLFYEGIEENLESEISLELDESIENVKITIDFMKKNKLIEKKEYDEYELLKF